MMKEVKWWRTSFQNGEADAIRDSISRGNVSQGPVVAELESRLAEYLNVPHVVCTTSGSMALLMSMLCLDIGPGDEVIVPNRTWIATAHAPFLLGAKVILVDVEADRPVIKMDALKKAITSRTRAIMPVHMGGRAADMDAILALSRQEGIAVVEDAAQALGVRTASGMLGTLGDFGCFSFSVAKTISTGQGGFVATLNPDSYSRLQSIRTQGVGDVVHAQWTIPGFNFRFTDVLASMGLVQLQLLPSRIERLNEIYKLYEDGLAKNRSVRLIPVDIESGEVPVYVEALCNDRSGAMAFMESRGVQCRPFYPSLHEAAYFENSGVFANSEVFSSAGFYLPSGPGQSDEDIQYVIESLDILDRSWAVQLCS